MPRSLKKGPFVDEHLQKKVDAQNEKGTHNVIKTWSRRSVITPDFLGHTFAVHDGRKHVAGCSSPSPWLVTSWVNSPDPHLPRARQGRPQVAPLTDLKKRGKKHGS